MGCRQSNRAGDSRGEVRIALKVKKLSYIRLLKLLYEERMNSIDSKKGGVIWSTIRDDILKDTLNEFCDGHIVSETLLDNDIGCADENSTSQSRQLECVFFLYSFPARII
jgi:hypothetical protein